MPALYPMLQVSLIRSYRSAKGNTTFVYGVKGNAQAIESYKTAQGSYYREAEDGSPLWFTTRCIGDSGKLVITSKGKVVPDMSAFEQADSLAKQYGGNFGAELAKASVAKLFGKPATDEESTK
jgi:hypothetical protein